MKEKKMFSFSSFLPFLGNGPFSCPSATPSRRACQRSCEEALVNKDMYSSSSPLLFWTFSAHIVLGAIGVGLALLVASSVRKSVPELIHLLNTSILHLHLTLVARAKLLTEETGARRSRIFARPSIGTRPAWWATSRQP
jgi:hypothetical protein